MLGIIVTLIAVFLLLCIAFYCSDQPQESAGRTDFLYSLIRK